MKRFFLRANSFYGTKSERARFVWEGNKKKRKVRPTIASSFDVYPILPLATFLNVRASTLLGHILRFWDVEQKC